jgi:hypothetical protein
MTEEENRGPSNLILLCIEHSYEIDEIPDRYPVAMLREWKRQQLAEYDQSLQSWPLTADQAEEISSASFGAGRTDSISTGAKNLSGVVRAVTVLIETGRRQRGNPGQAMLSWQVAHDRVSSRAVGHDFEGEPVYAQLSRNETGRHVAQVTAALGLAVETLQPLADAVHAELHVLRAMLPRLEPWCEWTEWAARDLVEAAGQWRQPPPFDDSESWPHAIEVLLDASRALAAVWRGEETAEPPTRPVAALQEPDARILQLQAHLTLLESARPWARVDHRQFDATLYSQLGAAMAFALAVPPTMSTAAFDLQTTASLAARVARNTDDSIYRQLITEAGAMRPLACATTLLWHHCRVTQQDERMEIHETAKGELTSLLAAQEWSDSDLWVDNATYAHQVLGLAAHLIGASYLRDRLAAALRGDPELLPLIVIGCAGWSEQLDREDWSLQGISRAYRELQDWFPTSEAVRLIHEQFPNLRPADHWESGRFSDPAMALGAQILHIAGSTVLSTGSGRIVHREGSS